MADVAPLDRLPLRVWVEVHREDAMMGFPTIVAGTPMYALPNVQHSQRSQRMPYAKLFSSNTNGMATRSILA